MGTQTYKVGEHAIDVSRAGKWLYPEDGLSKGDVVAYCYAVADTMLPHVRGRPLALRRFPDGIGVDGFFQKAASDHFPDWIRTVAVPQRSGEPDVHHVVCDEPATLLYLANQACLEFHTWPSPADALECPDRLVIDIDPPEDAGLAELRRVARDLRSLVEAIGLTAFVQATGGKGFHVVAPLDGADDYEVVRPFARELAERLVVEQPDRLTVEQRKDSREDRIFLDTNRNAYGQTAITPYSARARAGAPVATPLDWDELGRARPNGHRLGSIERRLAHKADPWRDIAEHAGSARRARDQLTKL